MRPRPEWIRSFLASADNTTYEAAADSLNLAQPTVWKQVKHLTDALGLELFVPGGVNLTSAGESILPFARQAELGMSALEEAARRLRLGVEGTVRIGCYPAHVRQCLAEAASNFKRTYPNATLRLASLEEYRNVGGEPAHALLREGLIDLAVAPKAQEFEGRLLYSASLVVVFPDDNPHRDVETVDVELLAELDLLLAPEGHTSRNVVESFFFEQGVEPRVAAESSQWAALLALGAKGFGVPIMYEDALPQVPERSYPRIVSHERVPHIRQAWLLWRKNEPMQPIVQRFVDVVEAISGPGSSS